MPGKAKRPAKKRPQRRWVYVGGPVGRIPDRTRDELTRRLQQHVAVHWRERCREVLVRFHGGFAYVDAFSTEDPGPRPAWHTEESWAEAQKIPTHLCRLAYLGSLDRWEFAFYKYSDERYEKSFLPSGSFEGTPEEGFDCAAGVYLR